MVSQTSLIQTVPEKYSAVDLQTEMLREDLKTALAWLSRGTDELKKKAETYLCKIVRELILRGDTTFHFATWQPRSLEVIKSVIEESSQKKEIRIAPPHGRLIFDGKETAIVRPSYIESLSSGFSMLVSGDVAFGYVRCFEPEEVSIDEFRELKEIHGISDAEREMWWGPEEPLFLYRIRDFFPFKEPVEAETLLSEDCTSGVYSVELKYKPFASPMGSHGHMSILKAAISQVEFKNFCEPYCGSADMFWAMDKLPEGKIVLNDLQPDIIATFRFLKNGSDADFRAFRARNWRGSKKLYRELLKKKPQSLADRAYRFVYLNNFSYAAIGGQSNERQGGFSINEKKRRAIRGFLAALERFRDRLKKVTLEQQDAIKLIPRVDSEETLFFIDPPYYAMTGFKKMVEEFKAVHFPKLIEKLKKLKGKFLLELSDDPHYTKLLLSRWKVSHFAKKSRGTASKYEEKIRKFIIVSNFEWKVPSSARLSEDEPSSPLDEVEALLNGAFEPDLLSLHAEIHSMADGILEDGEDVGDDLCWAHCILVDEMRKRGIEHCCETLLDFVDVQDLLEIEESD